MNQKSITKRKNDVPYIVFEGELARAERHIKRLWIALILSVLAVFISNCIWIFYIQV